MPVPAITLNQVTKKYGSSRGVQDIDLEVQQGQIFGFLGPNGAGKTTTIRLLLDFIRPSSGKINILGLDSKHDAINIRRRVGYLAGDMEMDHRLTGRQYLEFCANLRGDVPWSNIQKLVDRFGCQTDKKLSQLSRGNKQKVGLVAALMHDPDLLILDEPTSGLDPLVQAEFQQVILDHRRRGKTAFISSHVLSEIQQLCDQVGFIRDGQLVDVQPLRDLEAKAFKKVRLTLSRASHKALQGVPGLTDIQIDGHQVNCKINGNYRGLLQALAKLPVKDLTIEDADLDDLFLHYYQDPSATGEVSHVK
ncbi:MAG: ABC transporter ATP-binding protein [Candidatus Saccharimonadales bacterium]